MNWKQKNAEIGIYIEFKGVHNIIQVCCFFFLLSHELDYNGTTGTIQFIFSWK